MLDTEKSYFRIVNILGSQNRLHGLTFPRNAKEPVAQEEVLSQPLSRQAAAVKLDVILFNDGKRSMRKTSLVRVITLKYDQKLVEARRSGNGVGYTTIGN